jgi:hypothetical protein
VLAKEQPPKLQLETLKICQRVKVWIEPKGIAKGGDKKPQKSLSNGGLCNAMVRNFKNHQRI